MRQAADAVATAQPVLEITLVDLVGLAAAQH